jgi:predicted transcriptional regulator
MPSQHKAAPLSIRLPEAERLALREQAEREGRPVNQLAAQAIREYLARAAEVDGDWRG